MPLDLNKTRNYLQNFEFSKLFIEELGWDRHELTLELLINSHTFTLHAVAQKRGVQIFECRLDSEGKIPDHNMRRKIEKQITKCAYEHLIIFTDGALTTQIWQWVARAPGQPTGYREHSYHPRHQSGDALIQKLSAIMIPLDEEEAIDLTGAVHKLRDAFDRDRVTKKFYDHFKREHAHFLEFIRGIGDQADKEWYASLMLNRLMFVYFIQKKGFLDGDPDYLQNRLKAVQERKGKGKFLTFYRYFLLVLFHEGFSKQPQQRQLDRDLKELLGEVPYLNGGLFEVHELEEKHPKLDIPDEGFENLFAFFDQYEWTLDTRPLRNDKEINPDVLGYIFEKYINQKEMGAYYTKEDITEYISKNTVIPYLFDAAKKKCAVAFESGSAVWRLLEEDPDRYIYSAVCRGVINHQGEVIPLPKEIDKGIKSVSQREGWNRPAGPDYALPTETWRENVTRRQRCLEIREKLRNGEIHEINDFITYNLNIRQFAEDVITSSEGPELLRAFYETISTVTVLDPTCGSGAFLFTALNILEPLYNACLDRMHAFIEDLERSGERHSPRKFEDFRKTLAEVDRHPNRTYFILKSIIVNNLYGVDIMEEAVEICKLRLFLKLVAQVDKTKDLEPLPDVDFNIQAGNTLVGFVSSDEIRRAAEKETSGQKKILFGETTDALHRIEEEAEVVERAYQKFHEMQTEYGMNAREFSDQKRALREKLDKLKNELDRYLAREYGVDPEKSKDFTKWRINHFPFHWFAEFYGIMRRGGFDTIIGNPPYLERSKFNGQYTLINYQTNDCRDIYSWVVERVQTVRVPVGRIGLIVPVSIASSASFDVVRNVISKGTRYLWFAHFANRPSQLFSGAQNRLTIFLHSLGTNTETVSTRYHRWDAKNGEREFLFTQMCLAPIGDLPQSLHGLYPKIGNPEGISVIKKIWSGRSVAHWLAKSSKYPLYWVRVPGYFCQFFIEPPMAKPERGGSRRVRGELNTIYFSDEDSQRVFHAVLNSSTYFQFYCAYTDGRHVNPSDVKEFPFDYEAITGTYQTQLIRLSKLLANAMKQSTSYWRKSGLLIESVDSRPTKSILDDIDRVLAKHYGFTDEELDFIINYDVKYRMGASNTEDDNRS